jgi:hypothetical protein
VRQNSNFHLLKEAYQRVLTESALPPVGPGVCYFETDGVLERSIVRSINTTTRNWEFILKDKKPVGIASVDENGKPSGKIVRLDLCLFNEAVQLLSFDGSSLSALTDLDLRGNKLTQFNDNGLSALTRLHLSYNKLTSYRDSNLPNLDELGLEGNQLSDFDGSDMSTLKRLFLDDNKLTSFDGFGLSALDTLSLSYNKLTSFNGRGLSNLQHLSLRHNKLTYFDGSSLPAQTECKLNGNPFHNLKGPAVILPNGTEEYWIDGKKCEDEHAYKVARAKYLSPQDAAKVMKDAADKLGISDMEDLFKDF